MLFIMLIAGLCAGVILTSVHYLTKERIDANRELVANERMAGLVPTLNQAELCQMGIHLEEREAIGYGGTMTVVIAYKDGKILGARVTRHHETPGFAEILEPDNWIGLFGRETESKVDTVSGATITSNAVIRAVDAANTTDATRQTIPEC